MDVFLRFHSNPLINPYTRRYGQSPSNAINNLPVGSEIANELLSIKRIIGPNSLAVMKLNGKIILMFGDYHYKTDECNTHKPGDKSIVEILDLFERYSPKVVDLFIEAYELVQGYQDEYKDKYSNIRLGEVKLPDTMLSEIIKQYWPCFGNDKTLCRYEKLRIHNMDFRRNPNPKYDLYPISSIFNIKNTKIAYLNLIIGLLYGDMDMVADSLNIIRNTQEYRASDIIHESNYTKVAKQYENIPKSRELREEIVNRFITGVYDIDISEKYKGLYTAIIEKYIMDIYALPRIIKSIYLYNDSGIIVVYGGYAHISDYTEILQKLYGAKIVTMTDNPDDSRIRIAGMITDVSDSEILNLVPKNSPIRSCIDISQSMMISIVNSLLPLLI